jgi:glucosamine-6-phosphate deaminase
MSNTISKPRLFQIKTLKFEIHDSRESAGRAAALAAANEMRLRTQNGMDLGIIFATGASQLSTLHALTSLPDLPWEKIIGFHMDEYLDLKPDHFASFRRYLREQLTERVPIKEFYEIDGSSVDPEAVCNAYAARLRAVGPRLCLLGIGENGHLAFNDPCDADFNDPRDVRVATLDKVCREQQVAEGWFPSLEAVPARAITLTIPTLFRVPKLIVSVPGSRKAKIVRRLIEDEISTACPATLLRTHPDATVYLDNESSVELSNLLAMPTSSVSSR